MLQTSRPTRLIMSLSMGLAIVVQLFSLLQMTVIPLAGQIITLANEPAWKRSLIISPHFDHPEVISFLRDEIPNTSVLYFTDSNPIFSWKPVLQYFLFPKEVEICQGDQIVSCLGATPLKSVVLVEFPGFPEIEGVPAGFHYLPVPGSAGAGIYIYE